MLQNLNNLKKEIENLKNPEKAQILQWFFKTGKWQYWEWDIFYGIIVPEQRKLAKKYYKNLDFEDLGKLIDSPIHEERLISLLILIEQFEKWNNLTKKEIFNFYLTNSQKINNWDLVDLSAPKIIWSYLLGKKEERKILYKLSDSSNLWEKRISIISTFAFIKNKEFDDAIKICKILINDSHDLIHKATWWMLREIWKREEKILLSFLEENIKSMPRTMLRYAIEKLEEEKRLYYLNI